MTDYIALYQQKKLTADEVAARVENGWLIGMDAAIGQTPAIIDAICRRAENSPLSGVRVQMLLDVYPYAFYADDHLTGKVMGESWFASGGARKALAAGLADYVPNYYRDCPRHIRANYEYDAFCVSVSPMDKHGYFSLGTVSSYSPAMIDKAKHIYVEVNENTPRAVCGTQLHISQIDGLVENTFELPTLPAPKLDDVSITIGNLIAEQIPDGACIQLGIGAIPDAVGMALKAKHDLGIHTEMFTSSMVDLIECGAVNNSRKQIHRGKSVTTFAFGSKAINDYIDDNPAMEILPVNYVNDPAVICQHPNFISINAALEVDFYGQVCAEGLGTKHISGTGGQADFVRGAIQSEGGKSFIAFSSTAAHGTVSRITPTLTPGSPVSTSKNDVDMIVTEYGIAKLRGRSLSQRTKALIAIADPKFRDELTFQAKKENIII